MADTSTSVLDAPTDTKTGADDAPGSVLDVKDAPKDAAADATGKVTDTTTSSDKQPPADASKGDGDKPADKTTTVVPEKYADPKLPETMAPLSSEFKNELDTLAKGLGLSQENYQKVVDLGTKLMETNAKQAMDLFQQQHKEWAEETKKTLGAEFDAQRRLAAKAIDRVFTDPAENKAFREMLSETRSGLGNWLPLVKAFAFFGKAISEDTLVPGKSVSHKPEKTAAEIIFDHPTSIAAMKGEQ